MLRLTIRISDVNYNNPTGLTLRLTIRISDVNYNIPTGLTLRLTIRISDVNYNMELYSQRVTLEISHVYIVPLIPITRCSLLH